MTIKTLQGPVRASGESVEANSVGLEQCQVRSSFQGLEIIGIPYVEVNEHRQMNQKTSK